MSAALTNYERWERELQDDKMRGKAKPAEPMDAAERANRFHLEVLGTLAEMGIVTPLEGYLKPGAPSVSSAIKGVARQAEQAARQDERRKVLEEEIPEKWPVRGPDFNSWNADVAKFLRIVQGNPNLWLKNSQLKYLVLRVDTRPGGHFMVEDRDGNAIAADTVISAIRALAEEVT